MECPRNRKQMALRTATLDDCEIIAEFGNELITKSKYGPILFKDFRLVSAEIPYCVELEHTRIIEKDNISVGFVSYQHLPWLTVLVGKIIYIYIKPEFRGQGLMSEVKEDFETWARNLGCNFVMLGITTGVEPSDYEKYEVMYMKELV
jgi:GNAT superfamily N-acetyltransferase